jgi:hypothetical protein
MVAHGWKFRLAAAMVCGLAMGWAAPPLATVQDILYKADGSLFNGFMQIEWQSFDASDSSNIATNNLTVPIVNGVVVVRLVPNTSGSSYAVRYSSDGKIQFQETWVVPGTAAPVRIRDVRVAAAPPGSVTAPPAETSQVSESDVVGLLPDLAARPVQGAGYAPGRAVYIDAAGALEAVVGDLSDCVRVDGTTGPCGTSVSGGSAPDFVDGETPAGLTNGSNAVFTITGTPAPAASLVVYRNGLLQKQGLDYGLNASVITFTSGAVPQPGDVLTASYRLAGAGNTGGPAGGDTVPQVLCSSTGTGTSSTGSAQLGSCTIAAGSLKPGDRVDIRFDYSHEGSSVGFTFEVRWGGTTLTSRAAAAGETVAGGRADAAVHSSGAQWNVQSWGSGLTLAASAGTAADSLAASITVAFLGGMSEATSETVTLRNFTVLRYPARQNP